MELTERKRAVLKAIVKAYIDTGEPIGSKNLMLLLDNAPSSATLRNEMSELCELGLLLQPHTSAGRIPTSKGYRFYVDSLMSPSVLPDKSARYIKEEVETLRSDPESMPVSAAKILSELTGLPAVACLIPEKIPRIKRIELLPIGKFSTMLLLITDDGRTRNRIFRQGRSFTEDMKNCFDDIVRQNIKGKPINELTKAYMQSVIVKSGIYSLSLMPLLTAAFETASEIETSSVTLSGDKYLYNVCSDEKQADGIFSLIRRKDPIVSIFESAEEQGGVVFGADTGFEELSPNTVIASKFTSCDKYKGYLGIIGPNRMSYEQIIPFIKYTADVLTVNMTEAQKDMED